MGRVKVIQNNKYTYFTHPVAMITKMSQSFKMTLSHTSSNKFINCAGKNIYIIFTRSRIKIQNSTRL
jgi:hypothetical protein